jgi:hypothetical protein
MDTLSLSDAELGLLLCCVSEITHKYDSKTAQVWLLFDILPKIHSTKKQPLVEVAHVLNLDLNKIKKLLRKAKGIFN